MSNTNMTIKKEIFNDVYYPYLRDYEKRFEVYYGGAGSGKSVFVFQKIVYKYLSESNRKCLVVRKTQNSLKDSCFYEIKKVLSEWQIIDQCKINKTDLTIELPNGSNFLFKGMDDEEKIKSISDISDIIVEECTEIDMFNFDQLSLRLRSKKPYNQIFCMFNPVSKDNWTYKRWFKDGYNEKTTRVLHTTYMDNKFLKQDYIDDLLEHKKNNPVYYSIYALGVFASLDKLIYTNWKEESFDYHQILKEVKDSKAIFSLDFGFTNDPTAFVCSIIDKVNKKLWIFDEFQEKGLLNDEIAKKIIDMGFRKEVIVCDSAEPKSIEELRRNGLDRVKGATKGKDSIINGINLLQQFEIIVNPKCTYIIEELRNYTWIKDKSTNEYKNVPIDRYNHGLDSLRYGVSTDIGKAIKGKITVIQMS